MLILLFLLALPLCTGCALHPEYVRRIDQDLSVFSEGITPEMIQKAKQYPNTCSVVIKDHQVVSNCLYPVHFHVLSSIATYLPDMEFVVNMLDEPRIFKNKCPIKEDWKSCACDKDYEIPDHGFFLKPDTWVPIYEKLPIFSPASIPKCFSDILMPSHLHLNTPSVPTTVEWRDKKFKAIWRGSSTGGSYETFSPHYSLFHRHKLISLCSKIDDCDAKFSGYCQCEHDVCESMKERYGEPQFIPLQHQFNNKIIIDIDGNTYSGRFPILLSSGSAVFKVAEFEDIGTIPAKPWVHYVPIKMDLSDLEEKLEWARNNDAELEQIAIRAKELAKKWLNVEVHRCYMARLLLGYSDLLVSDAGSMHLDF